VTFPNILQTSEQPGTARRSLFKAWLLTFVAAFSVYLATATHDVGWQDAGMQQLRIVTGQLHHERGLALDHPLQYYLGRLFIRIDALEPAFAVTLVSVVGGAVAIANLLTALLVLTRRRWPAIIAAGAAMWSHTFWQHSTHTEVYALVGALLTGEWLCLAFLVRGGKGTLFLPLALLNGLGIATHLIAALALPVDAVLVLWAWRTKRISGRLVALAALFWLVGTAPYSWHVLSAGLHSGDWAATIHSALFGDFAASVVNSGLSGLNLGTSLGYVCYNFPNLTLFLAVYAFWARRDYPRWFMLAAVGELLIFGGFVVRYNVVDQYSFYFPVYLLLAMFAGMGLARVVEVWPKRPRRFVLIAAAVTVAFTPLCYAITSRVLAARGAFAEQVGSKPYRDGYACFFEPWGIGDNYGKRLNAKVAELVGDNGVVLDSDGMIQFGVRYAQAIGQIPSGVKIRRLAISASREVVENNRKFLRSCLEEGRPAVLIPRDRDNPKTCVPEATWTRSGDLYVLKGLDGAKSPADR
jgi:hypothetical protein